MPRLPDSKKRPWQQKSADRPWIKKSFSDQSFKPFYNSDAWIRLRKMILNNEPLCRECKKHDRLTEATTVDHIIPLRDGGPAYDTDNLQPLCDKCHKRKTAIDANRRRKAEKKNLP